MNSVLECVCSDPATVTTTGVVRLSGAVGRVSVPHYATIPNAQPMCYCNVTVSDGPAPARAYSKELLPDVLDGRIEPCRVFDHVIRLDEVPAGYAEMDKRESIKAMVKL